MTVTDLNRCAVRQMETMSGYHRITQRISWFCAKFGILI